MEIREEDYLGTKESKILHRSIENIQFKIDSMDNEIMKLHEHIAEVEKNVVNEIVGLGRAAFILLALCVILYQCSNG